MSRQKSKKIFIIVGILLALGLCLAASFVLFGSGLTFWFVRDDLALADNRNSAAARAVRVNTLPTLPTNTATLPPTNTPTPSTTPTPTSLSTDTPTVTPSATATPLPTASPIPATATPRPATATPLPTDTPSPPSPDYPFIVKETNQFNTSHLNFDVYVAIVNEKNRPLSGYRVIGTHSSGLRVESQVSAGDWTANSGAMHYKAGNIKYEVANSPTGTWSLQLVDEAGTPVGPPIEFAFDANDPSWYFLLYQRE